MMPVRCILTCVVQVTGPLVVVGQLRKHRFRHQFLGLIVQVEVQVVPQQQVQENGLTVGIVTQSRCAQTSVEETEKGDDNTEVQ